MTRKNSDGDEHIGQVGGESTVVTEVLVLSTDAYADTDVLTITAEVENAVRVIDGTGVIQTVCVQDDDDQAGAFDIVFFDANTSMGAAANATLAIADGDTILGIVNVAAADYDDMINSQHATYVNVGIVIKAASGTSSIYMGCVSRDAKTYSASGITIRLGILQD